ncbi:hypothetical protein [Marivita geojedonensis]|uniref:Lipoprotein n=1 Tax=Marivita geojedonensis TaxID=1123756 RepID=A0A1X4NNY5_9RHOB|nr:hypothetical protein [Marivita geojedonensis]OSQ52421.1 hypothetical protein MGEO_03260 [Marivita geojedonensis]PRY73275.1 hypothetical protein CLV76_13127 [Marivita geojedonensis]
MKKIKITAALSAAFVLAGCVEDTGGVVTSSSSAAEQACLQRVSIETKNADVSVLRSSFS